MDQVVEFMRDFIKAEHAAQMAQYTERDDAAFAAKLDALKAFYAPALEPDVRPPATRNAAYFKEAADTLDTIQPRVLFQIKHYKHPKLGDFYRTYVTDKIRAGKKATYFANLYVIDKKGKLQITAKYIICLDCEGTGKVDGKRCPECKGKGWEYFFGIKIPALGAPDEVRKLHKPDNAAHLADYEAE